MIVLYYTHHNKEQAMQYPEYFTADDIMEFEFEYNRYLDRDDPMGT